MSEWVNLDPQSETDDIVQCVRTILATSKRSVPLARDLGVSMGLDLPMQAAKAVLIRDVIDVLATYEPRIEVVSVGFTGDNLQGTINPTVTFRLKSGGDTISV